MTDPLTYRQAGVNIDAANAAKLEMAKSLASRDRRILNRPGAFASLFEAKFPGTQDPVLVFKSEEPGSKQLLAFRYGLHRSICFDLINHLINDIVVMGAEPLAVLDTIICGGLQKAVVVELVDAMAEACRAQGCSLVGGETSEQPGVIAEGGYVLGATVIGVVDRKKIVDGSRIREGDTVLALASSGPHTNGYTLIRKLIEKDEGVLEEKAGDETFRQAIMRPHRCYNQELRPIFAEFDVHGLAHITGGGIRDNLKRIIPAGLSAQIEIKKLRIPPVFEIIGRRGGVPESDMLRTFNMGVGIILVADGESADQISARLNAADCETYPAGSVTRGEDPVRLL